MTASLPQHLNVLVFAVMRPLYKTALMGDLE